MSAAHASRRSLLTGGLAAGAAAVAAGAAATRRTEFVHGAGKLDAPIAFRGPVQSGVLQPPPRNATWLGLDLDPATNGGQLRGLFEQWTDDFERLMSGRTSLSDLSYELADGASALTMTLGVGPSVPAKVGQREVPTWLAPLPKMPIDKFEKPWKQTDLVIQIRGDDALTISNAVRTIVDGSRGAVHPRWVQRGYRPRVRQGDRGVIRNAFGQLDGMVNPAPDSDVVWCDRARVPAWMVGGSSLVLRRIRMDMVTWAGVDRTARENAIGRRLPDGAPLSGGGPDAPVDLHAKDALGFPKIDSLAHMRLAMPHAAHEQILRVPYTYEETLPGSAEPDVGLLFAAYQADPVRQFLPIQRRLAESDLMNLWTTPIGSAVYALLPGVGENEHLGQRLFH